MTSVSKDAVYDSCCFVISLDPLTTWILFLLCMGINLWHSRGTKVNPSSMGNHPMIQYPGLVLRHGQGALRCQLGLVPCVTPGSRSSQILCPSCPSFSPPIFPFISWEDFNINATHCDSQRLHIQLTANSN